MLRAENKPGENATVKCSRKRMTLPEPTTSSGGERERGVCFASRIQDAVKTMSWTNGAARLPKDPTPTVCTGGQ